MITEPFAAGDSSLHRMDPRIRLVSAAAYSAVVALCRDFSALGVALSISIFLVGMARLKWRDVLKRLLVVNGLVVFLWAAIPLTYPGQTLFDIGPLQVSRQGVLLAAQITLKSNAIVLAFIALVATMPFSTVGHALHRLRVPDKIIHLLLMTYRYIFVLEHEYQRLVRAARIRGFQPGTNLHAYRTYAYLVGMLFLRAAERAERVRWAMICRGFKRRFYSLQEFKAGRGSIMFLLFMSAVTIGIAAVELRQVPW